MNFSFGSFGSVPVLTEGTKNFQKAKKKPIQLLGLVLDLRQLAANEPLDGEEGVLAFSGLMTDWRLAI